MDHVRQNVGASYGRLPDEAMRRAHRRRTSRSSDVGVVDVHASRASSSSRPRTYYRLFELYNAAIWPAQALALGLGLWILCRPCRGSGQPRRSIPAILAACWLFVAVAFLALRYASINFAAVYFAWAFGLEAALLVAVGVARRGLAFDRPSGAVARTGMAIFAFALLVEPLAGPLLGRSWRQVEIFGVAPDPTAVATLGILLAARGPGRAVLMIIPVLWCLTTGAFLAAMEASDAWVAPAAAALAVGLAVRQAWARRRM